MTNLFHMLDSTFPDITRNRSNAESAVDGTGPSTSSPSSTRNIDQCNSSQHIQSFDS
ncbi:hypothetical protein HanRHA438_Chr07g0289001 [Helianthus annuus]|nr:hypothetical protein HanRHA438_Chr07g0289001 [Helianthus annuus]